MTTAWHAKHNGWWDREEVVVLGQEFGPAGPAVVDWLECKAKELNRGGVVKSGPRAVAHGCFVDHVTVCHVLSRCVTLGLLTDYEEDGATFKARISWWKADQDKFHAASRQQKRRAANTEDSDLMSRSVTVCHGLSQNVTLTRPDQIKETSTSSDVVSESDSTVGAGSEGPVSATVEAAVSDAQVARGLFEFWQQRCGHPSAKLTRDRRQKIEARLREGYTVEQIRKAIEGAARNAFVNEQGTRFDDIELICRNGSKLENFIERSRAAPAGTGADDWDSKYGPVAVA